MKRLLIALAATALLLSCLPSAQAGPAAPVRQAARYRIVPFVPHRSDRPRLVHEWRTWRAQHLRGYSMRVSVSCFCAPRGALVTRVHGRRVTSVHYRGHTREVAGHGFEMEQLYRLLRRAYAHADSVRVRFSARGVPSWIAIDRDRMAADDEVSYAVTVRRHGDPIVCPLATPGRPTCPGPPTA